MFQVKWQWTLDGNDIVSWRMPAIPPKQLWAHYHVWDRGCVCFPKREEKPSIPTPYSYLPRFRHERQMTEWPIIRTRLSTFKIGFYGQHGWRRFIILSGLCLKKENQPLFPSVLFSLKMYPKTYVMDHQGGSTEDTWALVTCCCLCVRGVGVVEGLGLSVAEV